MEHSPFGIGVIKQTTKKITYATLLIHFAEGAISRVSELRLAHHDHRPDIFCCSTSMDNKALGTALMLKSGGRFSGVSSSVGVCFYAKADSIEKEFL